jgi:hypothetical protein
MQVWYVIEYECWVHDKSLPAVSSLVLKICLFVGPGISNKCHQRVPKFVPQAGSQKREYSLLSCYFHKQTEEWQATACNPAQLLL